MPNDLTIGASLTGAETDPKSEIVSQAQLDVLRRRGGIMGWATEKEIAKIGGEARIEVAKLVAGEAKKELEQKVKLETEVRMRDFDLKLARHREGQVLKSYENLSDTEAKLLKLHQERIERADGDYDEKIRELDAGLAAGSINPKQYERNKKRYDEEYEKMIDRLKDAKEVLEKSINDSFRRTNGASKTSTP